MRIIAGKYGGQHLVSFQASHIRPTSDRVKESLFNKLREKAAVARVLDLFCGTGSLGIEALSRGSQSVTFVDDNAKSLAIVKRNLEKLQVSEDYQLIKKDVFRYLKAYVDEPFDLILIDPPFTESLADQVLRALAGSKVLASGTLVAIEAGPREKVADDYSPLVCFDRRDFGDKTLCLLKV